MYALAVILARLLDDNPSAGAGTHIDRQPAGDEIQAVRPAADPGLADFGLDIFGGP